MFEHFFLKFPEKLKLSKNGSIKKQNDKIGGRDCNDINGNNHPPGSRGINTQEVKYRLFNKQCGTSCNSKDEEY